MFKADLLGLLWRWKAAGDEVLLVGDFNENMYSGDLAAQLAGDNLWMTKMCLWTTGHRLPLPSTHIRGQTPIDGVFATCGLVYKLVKLLPSREGIGDHRVFLLDIALESILSNVFPRVIPVSCCLLNCASDQIKQSYITLLNQLANRHHIFRKLLMIDRDSNHIPAYQVQLRMNKVDLELKDFMKSLERGNHKYKMNNIEWSPYAQVWIHRRWLLKRVHKYLLGKTKDLRNLICDCHLRKVKSQLKIIINELWTEFYVCKQNIELLKKHSSYFWLEFLKSLVSTAKKQGETVRASKLMGMIQKEDSRKQWGNINQSTRKARGSLTVRVKVPTANGDHTEYKMKEGLFEAVSPIHLERF
jgi:hypothetical protein